MRLTIVQELHTFWINVDKKVSLKRGKMVDDGEPEGEGEDSTDSQSSTEMSDKTSDSSSKSSLSSEVSEDGSSDSSKDKSELFEISSWFVYNRSLMW